MGKENKIVSAIGLVYTSFMTVWYAGIIIDYYINFPGGWMMILIINSS